MLKIYNTLNRKKEALKKKKLLNLFVCGPTVYDLCHIGHAKTYIFFDFFTKYLRSKGQNVFYLQNITDIDDKIIARAQEKNISPQALSRKFEKEYFADIKELKINSVTKYARATEHIKEIISQVERLISKGAAYKTNDGIYYDISKFKEYGKLSKRTYTQAEDGVSRIDESVQKRNKGDFCLWKFSKPNEPKWKSPFGQGRPGWHIEDTAISEKYFGSNYDIHGGGRDLMFPHHDAEIAQMEKISGKKPFVKYWMHTGFLTVNNEKMSKSLGNFITIKDLLKKHNSRTLRYFFLKSHYRTSLDYSEEKIAQAKKELEKIDEFIENTKKAKDEKTSELLKQYAQYGQALENDLNTPVAFSIIFKLMSKPASKQTYLFFKEINKYLDIFKFKKEPLPSEIKKLAEKRESLRKQKKWSEADKIRKQIEQKGYRIQDTAKGAKVTLK